jgi:pyruvate dehydrogenase E2 component (dihydrolipoamide acetyltransferase)
MGERVFAMPDLGEGLEDGEIVAWLVSEGDAVALNDPLVEVETAKATVEVPSPLAGRVVALHGAVGATVPVGAPLATFEVEGETVLERGADDEPAAAGAGAVAPRAGSRAGVRATPPVRRAAKGLGVDLAAVNGTGPGGRITLDDVRTAAGDADAPAGATRSQRAAIAASLERQAAIPQVTTFRTVGCTVLEELRGELGVSPLPIVVAALCRTLQAHPRLNAAWIDDDVLERSDVHVGIAADTPRGLVVPVVHGAAGLGIGDLAAEIARLAAAAREGSLTPGDLRGATVAVSNTGSYGSEAGTPILSPGTSVTLAFGVIEARALAVDGEVRVAPACTLSCTFDHRVLDGADVGRALTDLVGLLESPERMAGLPR